MPRAPQIIVPFWLALAAGAAWGASRPSSRLVYERGKNAEQCPDEASLRRAVESRLGYDPFVADPSIAPVQVRIEEIRGGLQAVVAFPGRDQESATKHLTSRTKDCEELSAAVALAISVALDPMSIVAPAPIASQSASATATASTPVPAPSTPAPTPPVWIWTAPAAVRVPTASSPSTPPTLHAGLGLHASFGTAPATAWGVGALAGIRWDWFSMEMEARADMPASRVGADQKGVESSLLLLTLAPCVHRQITFACGLISGGRLHGHGVGVGVPEREETFYALAGVRAGVEVPISGGVRARGNADLFGTLRQTTLRLNGQESWTTPPLGAALSAGAIVRF